MVSAVIEITDSTNSTHWFEKTFLIIDIPKPIMISKYIIVW